MRTGSLDLGQVSQLVSLWCQAEAESMQDRLDWDTKKEMFPVVNITFDQGVFSTNSLQDWSLAALGSCNISLAVGSTIMLRR